MFFVFVYGSLRSGESNHAQMSGARLVSAESVAIDARLIAYVGGYPGLVRMAGARTVGEVYEVDAVHLARLDAFEGCPNEYFRAEVVLEDGREVFAYFAGAQAGHAHFDKERWPRSS